MEPCQRQAAVFVGVCVVLALVFSEGCTPQPSDPPATPSDRAARSLEPEADAIDSPTVAGDEAPAQAKAPVEAAPADAVDAQEPAREPAAPDAKPARRPGEVDSPSESVAFEQEVAEPSGEDAPPAEPPPPVPLVDDPEGLQPLHPTRPAWIDRDRKHVVLVGTVCQRQVPLELFACLKGSKEHEAVVSVDTEAYVVHAGLLLAGAEPGGPAQFEPEYRPARGTEIEVAVVWNGEDGRRRRARAQDWVRDVMARYEMFQGVVANPHDEELNIEDQFAAWRAMEYPWVFAGSMFHERDGQRRYLADMEGDLICVSNFPSAVLDVPVRSTDANAALLFEAFAERIPPIGTPVTLILTPKPKSAGGSAGPDD